MQWWNILKFQYQTKIVDCTPHFEQEFFDYITRSFTVTTHNHPYISFIVDDVFFVSYQITSSIYFDSESISINFKVDFQKLLVIILFFLIASVMFSTFSLSFLFWFSISIITAFWIIQMALLRNIFHKIIQHIHISESESEHINVQQKEWIANPDKCPACGQSISKYDRNCNECGLFIRNIEEYSKFSISEDLKNVNLNYTITDEKN